MKNSKDIKNILVISLTSIGDVILAFNVVLFLIAMSILGVEPALYSILTYLSAAKTLDFVIYGLEAYTAITIVSRENEAIRNAITADLGRGVTVLRGQGGMSGEAQAILYCVVTRLEVGKVRQIVRARDSSAFVTYHALADAEGGNRQESRSPLNVLDADAGRTLGSAPPLECKQAGCYRSVSLLYARSARSRASR